MARRKQKDFGQIVPGQTFKTARETLTVVRRDRSGYALMRSGLTGKDDWMRLVALESMISRAVMVPMGKVGK